jgi:hypothetical protein
VSPINQFDRPPGKETGHTLLREPGGKNFDMDQIAERRGARNTNHQPEAAGPGMRPIFTLRLLPEKGVDPIRALRGALKILLRKFGLRAASVEEGRAP